MRVLMTADAVGGVFTYAVTLARALAPRGVSTTLVLLGPEASAAQRDRARAIPGLKLIETGLPLDWMADRPDEALQAAESVAAIARREDVDLVHLHLPSLVLASAGYPCATSVVAHSCLATWWAAVKDEAPPAHEGWRVEFASRGYRACDPVLAPTAAFAQATAVAHGIEPPLVCHNGSDCPAKVDPTRPRKLILAAGRLWDDAKGIGLLSELEPVDASIHIAGPLAEPGRPWRQFPGLSWLGSLDAPALAEALSRTAVFVSPALYEPFGLTVLEAARAGCALVLSDIPSFRELWRDAALFAPPGDAAAFGAAVRGLMHDPGARLTLAMAAQERAGRYSASAVADCLMEAWRPLLPELEDAAA